MKFTKLWDLNLKAILNPSEQIQLICNVCDDGNIKTQASPQLIGSIVQTDR